MLELCMNILRGCTPMIVITTIALLMACPSPVQLLQFLQFV